MPKASNSSPLAREKHIQVLQHHHRPCTFSSNAFSSSVPNSTTGMRAFGARVCWSQKRCDQRDRTLNVAIEKISTVFLSIVVGGALIDEIRAHVCLEQSARRTRQRSKKVLDNIPTPLLSCYSTLGCILRCNAPEPHPQKPAAHS
jgi:hypothetical protein